MDFLLWHVAMVLPMAISTTLAVIAIGGVPQRIMPIVHTS